MTLNGIAKGYAVYALHSETNEQLFAVNSIHDGRNPLAIALRTERMLDHAAQ